MKKYLISAVLFIAALTLNAQNFNVGTYNVRNDNSSDVGNMWKDRFPYIAKLIQYHDFDFFGTQEALPNQLKDMKIALPGYDYYGEGRDGNRQGEHSAIFYKIDKYRLLSNGDFWLSATPMYHLKVGMLLVAIVFVHGLNYRISNQVRVSSFSVLIMIMKKIMHATKVVN